MKKLYVGASAAVLMFVGMMSASGQAANAPVCGGPIYTRKEVSKPAEMIGSPNYAKLYEALGRDVSARVTLEAVLCRSGHITDIRVITSEPPQAGEFVVAAVSVLRFKPAEMNWHTVSQKQQFEFRINERGLSKTDSAAAAGRLVEELDIIGNRRLTKDQILAWIKTRAGEVFDADQVQKDLTAILATGYFNALGTRVTLEDGVRGGVRVIFEVHELPVIREIKIEGLKPYDESTVINEFERQRVDMREGGPLDIAQLKKATHVIERLFQTQGWTNVKAEALVENVSATKVLVRFKISGRDF